MPKQKTNSGAKKRFKITGTGRLLRRVGPKSHNLEKKSAKRRRTFRRDHDVESANERDARRLLGRG